MFCYLPQNPTGRAVVDCPGGGYTHLAIQHEGHDWAGFFNEKGIALFVLQYRMPNGDLVEVQPGRAELFVVTLHM